MKNVFLLTGFLFLVFPISPLQAQTPLFTFTDPSVCQGETVLFENLHPDFCGYGYNWDFGDGSQDTARHKNVWHTYAQAGTYTASMSMTGDSYIYMLRSITVTAIPANWFNLPFDLKPDIYFKFKDLDCDHHGFTTHKSSSNLTLPHTFNFNRKLGRGNFEIEVWDYDAALFDDKIGEFPLNMSAGSGSYTKHYALGDLKVSWIIDSLPIDLQTQTIVVEPGPTVPVIQASGPFKVCDDSLLLFASSDPGIMLQWYKDGIALPNANGDSLIATETGHYIVEAINPVGCSPTSKKELIVIKGGALNPVLEKDDGPTNSRKYICVKDNGVTYGPELYGGKAKDGNHFSLAYYTFTWYKDGVIQSNPGNQTNYFRPSEGGDYWVVVTDTVGCNGSSDTLAISAHHETSAEVFANDTAYFCNQDTLWLQTNTSYWKTYRWYKDNQPIPDSLGGNQPNFGVVETGSYAIIHSDSASCFLPVHISNAPYVDVIDTQGNPYKTDISREGDTLFVKPALSYEWFDASTQNVLSTDPFFIPSQAGAYYVAIIDEIGCEAVSDVIHFYLTGLDSQLPDLYANVYPNPSAGIFSISLDKLPQNKGTVSILNLNGSYILRKELTGIQTEFNLATLSDGVYLMQIHIEGYAPLSKKIIIRH